MVVVGAGLAGLTCADLLAPSVDVVLLEARDRVGGRCWSSRGWPDGQVAEHGGELIEEGQDHVLALVRSLGLELEDRRPAQPVAGCVLLGGRRLAADEADEAGGFGPFVAQLGAELAALPGVTAATADDRARALDEMSVADWLAERLDGGPGSTLGQVLAATVRLNLGFAPSDLSALSLHHMFVGFAEGADGFAFGNVAAEPGADADAADADLEFADVTRAAITHTMHVRGGNDLIAQGVADRLPAGVLRLDAAVTAVRRRSAGDGGGSRWRWPAAARPPGRPGGADGAAADVARRRPRRRGLVDQASPGHRVGPDGQQHEGPGAAALARGRLRRVGRVRRAGRTAVRGVGRRGGPTG